MNLRLYSYVAFAKGFEFTQHKLLQKNSLFNLKYQCARSNIKNEQHEVSKPKLNVGLMQKNTLWFTDVFKILIQEHLIQIYALLQVPKNQYNNIEIINLIILISLYWIY